MIGPHPFHAVGEKYIVAVRDGAGAIPLLVPVLQDPIAVDELLDVVDGIFLTGSPSNVSPSIYGGPAPREGVLQDTRRDSTSIPLIQRTIERGKPFMAVCRGFQEMNVAFGGTLHQHLEEVPGRFDHREDKSAPLEVQYAPAHEIELARNGILERLAGQKAVRVNSLHGQGVDRLGAGLEVEAFAPDGTVEAIRPAKASTFALGVQWHPEWKYWEGAFSTAIFREFGQALKAGLGTHGGRP